MLSRIANPFLLLICKSGNTHTGFTIIDVIAHLFLIALLLSVLPILLTPSPVDNSAAFRYRTGLLLRTRY